MSERITNETIISVYHDAHDGMWHAEADDGHHSKGTSRRETLLALVEYLFRIDSNLMVKDCVQIGVSPRVRVIGTCGYPIGTEGVFHGPNQYGWGIMVADGSDGKSGERVVIGEQVVYISDNEY